MKLTKRQAQDAWENAQYYSLKMGVHIQRSRDELSEAESYRAYLNKLLKKLRKGSR